MTRTEKIYEFMKSGGYVPLTADELMLVLDVPKSDTDEFYEILDKLISNGKIIKSRKGRYSVNTDKSLVTGKYIGTGASFGFVESETLKNDLFIAAENAGSALNGDTVIAKVISVSADKKHSDGKIVRVIKRENYELVCTFKKKGSHFYAVPDNKKISKNIRIDKKHTMAAVNGQKVLVKLTSYGENGEDLRGHIAEVLGWQGEPKTDFTCMLRMFGLPEDFPEKVKAEVTKIPDKISGTNIENRRDLRGETIFTIDGEDAKDLDDAISLKTLENGNYMLSVHIADVSFYVKPGTEIFGEALGRGTSVYLSGGVVPMLPRELSNGICSLNEGCDRFALSVDMEITPKGEIVSHEIYKSVIKTVHRMTYTDVTKILNGNKKLKEQYADIVPMLRLMRKLSGILRKRRFANGSIDFNFPETKVVFDENGYVTDIMPYEYTLANIIIEEFMLAANSTVAEHYYWLETPFVYRVHENPSAEKITELMRIMSLFDLHIKGSAESIHPKALQQALNSIKGEPYERIVSTIMLRSMMKARYSTSCDGHFGLAAKYYCHFTSPIRRLADLAIHTIISADIEGRQRDFAEFAEIAAKNASEREIVAEEAERTSKKIKIAEYMSEFIDEEFDGVISSVTNSGLFVALENTAEGRVSVADMRDDYYIFSATEYSLVGEHTGKVYRMGDSIKVIIDSVNTVTGDINFVIADEE